MANLYFRNEKTGKKYQVVSMDKDAGTILLRGEHAEFTEKYDKDRFKKLGYVLEKE
jgi:glutamine amidotransferase-like uncharacterized protein